MAPWLVALTAEARGVLHGEQRMIEAFPLPGSWSASHLRSDLVRYSEHAGSLSNIATVLAELAERLDGVELVRVAEAEGEVAYAQRLGYLLELVRRPEPVRPLAEWVATRATKIVPLTGDGHGVALVDEAVQHVEQALDVGDVEPGRRLERSHVCGPGYEDRASYPRPLANNVHRVQDKTRDCIAARFMSVFRR